MEKVKWKKVGKGSHRFKNKIIKPGQTFMAYPHEISESMRTFIVPLDELPEEDLIEPIENTFTVEARGGGYYNIIDSQGKKMNEKALRKDAADQFIKEL